MNRLTLKALMPRRNATGSGFYSTAQQLAGTLFAPEPQQDSSPATRAADRRRVLGWYRDHTGSAHEAAKGLGMLYTTVLPRVTELRQLGFLQRIPKIRHATGLGGTAAVLIGTKAGREALASGKPLPRPPRAKKEAAA